MPETVCSEKVGLVNQRIGPEGWAALNKSLPGVKLTEGAFTILFENILYEVSERAHVGFVAALDQLDGLGLSKEQAYDLHEAIYDGAEECIIQMAEAAFIAGCELGYRALVVEPAKDNGK
jgi:hypothetical protein